jgi:hypothetical protein
MSSLQVDNLQTYNSNPPVIKNVSGTEVGTFCRAWVNFNGTGTVAIRASFNVSSITDNGTGTYTVNFTTAFADANYCVSGMAANDGSFGGVYNVVTPAVGSVLVWYIQNNSPAFVDTGIASVAIFR